MACCYSLVFKCNLTFNIDAKLMLFVQNSIQSCWKMRASFVVFCSLVGSKVHIDLLCVAPLSILGQSFAYDKHLKSNRVVSTDRNSPENYIIVNLRHSSRPNQCMPCEYIYHAQNRPVNII